MRSTQAKFITAAEALTAGTDLEFVNDPKWANTGTLRLQPLDQLRTLLRVEYDFQDNATSLRFGPPLPGLQSGRADTDPGWWYATSPAKLQQALDAMAAYIARMAEPKGAK